MKKIVIVGNVSSGKTTLANKLGKLLNIPVHHLDKIFWIQKGGIKQDAFIAQQKEMMISESWIIDGNFTRSESYDLRLQNADTIIYFDFPLTTIYWRLLKRSIKYFNKLRPDMGGTNKRHLTWVLIKFIWRYPAKEERLRVQQYTELKKVIVLHNTREEKQFLKKLNSTTTSGIE